MQDAVSRLADIEGEIRDHLLALNRLTEERDDLLWSLEEGDHS